MLYLYNSNIYIRGRKCSETIKLVEGRKEGSYVRERERKQRQGVKWGDPGKSSQEIQVRSAVVPFLLGCEIMWRLPYLRAGGGE